MTNDDGSILPPAIFLLFPWAKSVRVDLAWTAVEGREEVRWLVEPILLA
jgi:hypothetical protein